MASLLPPSLALPVILPETVGSPAQLLLRLHPAEPCSREEKQKQGEEVGSRGAEPGRVNGKMDPIFPVTGRLPIIRCGLNSAGPSSCGPWVSEGAIVPSVGSHHSLIFLGG